MSSEFSDTLNWHDIHKIPQPHKSVALWQLTQNHIILWMESTNEIAGQGYIADQEGLGMLIVI